MHALTIEQIDMVSGAGIFQSIGEALDNPWTTAGKAVDAFIEILNGPPLPPPPNLGFH